MTNEQQPADQGRGVGEDELDRAVRAAIGESTRHVSGESTGEAWRRVVSAAIAALTQPKGDGSAPSAKQIDKEAWEIADAMDGYAENGNVAAGRAADLIRKLALSLPRQSEAVKCEFCGEFTPINEQLIVYGKELSELMDACDQYLTTRLPSYERINNALKALKGRCAERDDASPRDGDLIVGGMAYDD